MLVVVQLHEGGAKLTGHAQTGHLAQERDPEGGGLEDVVVEAEVNHQGHAPREVGGASGQGLDDHEDLFGVGAEEVVVLAREEGQVQLFQPENKRKYSIPLFVLERFWSQLQGPNFLCP